ncbi:MAG: PAS domain S-box protein, partial [Methanoregula sp.]|nr:PAS domain S-box protein [Methanoregula sp.]
LLDINLPDIEGIRLIAPLKEITPDLAVIMITGFASMENAMRALNEGATGYVLKPVNIDEILSKIQDALERQHLIKSKQQAEETLRVSEEKYRSLVENINDVIYSLDEKGVITYISPVIEKISGYPPSQITGHPFTGFIRKEDLPGVMQTFEAARKGTITSFPFRVVTKSGEQRWLSSSSYPAFANGEFSGVQGVLSDITERRQAEEAVKAAVTLNQLIDTMSVGESMRYTLDEAERLTNSRIGFFHLINPDEQTIQLVAWSIETKKHCFIPKEPERNYPVSKAGIWVDCLCERKPVIHNDYASLPHKKGLPEGHVPVTRELVVPILDEDKIVAIIGVGNKATDYDEKDINVMTLLAKNAWTLIQRKRAEEALRTSEERFRTMIEQSPLSIEVMSPDGRTLQVNPAFEKLWGVTLEDLKDYNMLEDKQLISLGIMPYIQRGFSGEAVAYPPLEYDGSKTLGFGKKRWVQGSIYPVRDTAGIIRNVILVHEDITEQKKAEDALRESEATLHSILQGSPTLQFVIDKDHRVISWNKAIGEYSGLKEAEVLGTRNPWKAFYDSERPVLADLLVDEKVELISEWYAGKFSNSRLVEGAYEATDFFPNMGESGKWLFFTAAPIRNVKGEIIGAVETLEDITERKKAEEEDRLTRERFETLVKVSEMRDASETELSEYVMEAACRMTGSTLAFIGTMTPDESVMDLISWSKSTMPDCMVAASPIHFPVQRAGIWADAIRTHKPKIVNDYSAPHSGKKGLPEGHVRIMRFLSLPILDNGKVVMVAAVANKPDEYDDADVTRLMLLMQGVWGNLQIRRSEEALKMSEEKFRDIFNNANDAIEIVELPDNGPPGRYLDLNDVACRMLGYTKEEILRLGPLDINTDYFSWPFDEIMRELHTTGHATFETEHRRKDGVIVPVEVNSHKIALMGKTVLISIARDITERKKAEAAILQSEQKFRDIFNNTTDAIHIHGINDDGTPGRFTEVNDVTWRMLEYTKEELLTKTPLDIATDYHNPPIEKILEEQRTTGSARFETEYRRKDGTVIPVEINTHVVNIRGIKVMLGVVRDITERKKAEALMKHFNEELEQEVKVRTEELSASLDEKVVLLREVHHRVKNN